MAGTALLSTGSTGEGTRGLARARVGRARTSTTERWQHRCFWVAGARPEKQPSGGACRDNEWKREGEGKRVLEDQRLTLNTMERSVEAEEVGR